jgi:polyribonucleotide nucleotidyltransferase
MDFCYQKYYDYAMEPSAKEARMDKFASIKEECLATFDRRGEGRQGHARVASSRRPRRRLSATCVLDHGKRLDGRKTDQIRPIWSEVDVLPGTHGSAIFTRGETQAINLLTLGSSMDEQTIDRATKKTSESFMLHYNFPSFSTGEVKPIRGPGRREVGHGNLASAP